MNRAAFEGYMESSCGFSTFPRPMFERDGEGYEWTAINEHWKTWQHATRFALAPALLNRAAAQLCEWHVKYGKHNPEWLPPAGDVQLLEDITAALAA